MFAQAYPDGVANTDPGVLSSLASGDPNMGLTRGLGGRFPLCSTRLRPIGSLDSDAPAGGSMHFRRRSTGSGSLPRNSREKEALAVPSFSCADPLMF